MPTGIKKTNQKHITSTTKGETMKLNYQNTMTGKIETVDVKPVPGLAQAYRGVVDLREYRLLPGGEVLNGYFGIEIGEGGKIT